MINQVARICIVKHRDRATALTLAFAYRTIGWVNNPVMYTLFLLGSFNYISHSSLSSLYLIKTFAFRKILALIILTLENEHHLLEIVAQNEVR